MGRKEKDSHQSERYWLPSSDQAERITATKPKPKGRSKARDFSGGGGGSRPWRTAQLTPTRRVRRVQLSPVSPSLAAASAFTLSPHEVCLLIPSVAARYVWARLDLTRCGVSPVCVGGLGCGVLSWHGRGCRLLPRRRRRAAAVSATW